MLMAGMHYDKATVSQTMHTEDQHGNAALKVWVKIPDPEAMTEDGNATVVGTIYTSPKAVSMARRQLKNIGFDPDTQDFGEIGKSVSLVGNEVKGGIDIEEFKGNLKVKFFGRMGGASDKALSAATAALRAAKKNNAPGAVPAEEPPTDEDIPF